MKTALTVMGLCSAVFAIAQPTYNYQKRFQVRSGHVEYRLSGNTTGTKSLWWDEYGEKYREEINSSQLVKTGRKTETVKSHSLSIFDGTYYYNVNMETMEGTKLHKDAVPDFSVLGSGLNDGEMEELGENLLGALGGKVVKNSETVLGRSCDVSKAMGVTIHSYKGVILKSYSKMFSVEESEEAVSFDENAKIPASVFELPVNAAIEDVTADVSGEAEYYDDEVDADEEGLIYAEGIEFETYRDESERVRRSLGYTFALHDASGGEYSSMWLKDQINTVWIL